MVTGADQTGQQDRRSPPETTSWLVVILNRRALIGLIVLVALMTRNAAVSEAALKLLMLN
tara:strand:+ start:251 stop:430 length:180 start_codon:yes stop_codon:yes gene_type:complete